LGSFSSSWEGFHPTRKGADTHTSRYLFPLAQESSVKSIWMFSNGMVSILWMPNGGLSPWRGFFLVQSTHHSQTTQAMVDSWGCRDIFQEWLLVWSGQRGCLGGKICATEKARVFGITIHPSLCRHHSSLRSLPSSVSSQFCSCCDYSRFQSLSGVGSRVASRTGTREADSLPAAICHAT
jgi:hypothetical protein